MGGAFSRLTKHRYHEFHTAGGSGGDGSNDGSKEGGENHPTFRVSLNHGFGIADVWVDTVALAEPEGEQHTLPIHWATVMFDRVFLGDPEGMAGTPISVLFELNRNVHPDCPRYLHLGGGRGAVFFDGREPGRERALVYRCFRGGERAAGVYPTVDGTQQPRAYLLTESVSDSSKKNKKNKDKTKKSKKSREGDEDEKPQPHTVYLITESVFAPFHVWTRQATKSIAGGEKGEEERKSVVAGQKGDAAAATGGEEEGELHLQTLLDHARPTSLVPDQKIVPFIDPYATYTPKTYTPKTYTRSGSSSSGSNGSSDKGSSGNNSSSSGSPPPKKRSLPKEREYFHAPEIMTKEHGDLRLGLENMFMRVKEKKAWC